MSWPPFLCLGNRRWDGFWSESQKLFSRIAKNHKVFYIEPGRGVNEPLLEQFAKASRSIGKLHYSLVAQNLVVVSSPPELPIGRRHLPRSLLRKTVPVTVRLNSSIKRRHVLRVMDHFKISCPILWVYSPYDFMIVGTVGEKLSCYHNYDEFPDFTSNVRIRDIIRGYDNELTDRATVVFATSRAQTRRRKSINPRTHFIPNGVDFDIFNRATRQDLPVPHDISAISHPIIGYAGIMGNHIDMELLLRASTAYPNYSFVLIGPDFLPRTALRRSLTRRTNVHFLGAKQLVDLPNYLRVFDAALIPYNLEGHVLSGYPQKLHEYLAAGRSVVATAMPELLPYRHLIHIGSDKEHFLKLIETAVTDHGPEKTRERIEVAGKNTWDRRVEAIYEALQPFVN